MLEKAFADDRQDRGDRGAQNLRGILESRAVGNVPNIKEDKGTFRHWNERLVNAVTQVRRGSKHLFKAMTDYVDQDRDENFEDVFKDNEGFDLMEREGLSYERMDEDIYAILADKKEGEAALRSVRGFLPGQGVEAYMRLYK